MKSSVLAPQKLAVQLLCLFVITASWNVFAWTFHPTFVGSPYRSIRGRAVSQEHILGALPESTAFSNNDDDNDESATFFLRPSIMADMGPASKILADGFYKGRSNFFTYQWERLETYLSLESGFPKANSFHEIIVACDKKTGRVLGMVEVDARMTGENVRGQNGPYMCNLAVDEKCQRRGIASALVRECEGIVRRWHRSTSAEFMATGIRISNSLYLKVRDSNKAAVMMYDKLGYRNLRQELDDKTGDTVLVMRKQLSDLEETSNTPDKNDASSATSFSIENVT